MTRSINRLTATQWKNAKGPKLYCDGGGLNLKATSTGGSVLFRYKRPGAKVPTDVGLGSRYDASLAQFREIAAELRAVKARGDDPQAYWREKKRSHSKPKPQAVPTFLECANNYISAHSAAWSNVKHVQQWENTIRDYTKPIHNMPVDRVDVPAVKACLTPIWHAKTETASRVRGRIEKVLAAAIVDGHHKGPNPALWRGVLSTAYPEKSKIAPPKHHEAMPWNQMPQFMPDLRAVDGIAAKALELLILTACRTGEVIGAEWDEFDLEAGVWTIPAARMKMRREQKVPLSTHALGLVQWLRGCQLSDRWLFPSPVNDGARPISNMAMATVIRRLPGWDDVTVHGFRSSFRDWAAECSSAPAMVAELCLAHKVGDAVEQAYLRSELLLRRRNLLEEWAEFCFEEHKIFPINVKSSA